MIDKLLLAKRRIVQVHVVVVIALNHSLQMLLATKELAVHQNHCWSFETVYLWPIFEP